MFDATAIADDLRPIEHLDTAESALASARARSSRISGTVHIAAPSDLLGEMIAPRLAPLLDAGLDLRLHIGGREALYALLLEDKVHLAVTASQPEDPRLAFHALGEEHLRAVASAVASRIAELPLAEGLIKQPTSPTIRLPLLRTSEANQIELTNQPALTAPDLRVLRSGLYADLGWTVLPGYLTRSERAACTLIEIPAPITVPRNAYYLVWARSSLRHPRVAMARDALIAALRT